jgi:mannose-6-phosphate isomerase-like protein (cupin superfamily)
MVKSGGVELRSAVNDLLSRGPRSPADCRNERRSFFTAGSIGLASNQPSLFAPSLRRIIVLARGGIEMAKSSWVIAVPRIEKPWGHEEHFALVDGRYCGKALYVNAGHALSLQYHEQKEETVSVQSGRLLFEVGGPDSALESFELLPGEAVHLRPGTRHRMTALEDTVILEASTTELDDVVRLEDRYGRV